MPYKIVLRQEADDDLDTLSHREKILVFKQLKKTSVSPELGQRLGKRSGYDLSGYRKMYADQKKIRIVYTIVEDQIIVEVVAIGKRDDMEVYKKASERIDK